MNKLAEPIFIIRSRQQEEVIDRDIVPSCGGRVVILSCCGNYSIIKLIELLMQENSSPEDR